VATLTFCRSEQDNTGAEEFVIESAEAGVYIEDVVDHFLGVGGASWVGAIHYETSVPAQAYARVYSISADGSRSFGQLIEGIPSSDMSMSFTDAGYPGTGEDQWAFAVKHTSDGRFRVNVGIVNPTSKEGRFRYRIFDETDNDPPNNASFSELIPPYSMLQLNDPFRNVNGGDWNRYAIRLEAATAGTGLFGYASVVDNATNDAFFVRGVKRMAPPPPPCIESGDQTDINDALAGPYAKAVLCQDAEFELTGAVWFSADGQQVFTEGYPTDDRRAVLRVASPDVSTAVVMFGSSDAVLSHVVVDGSRPLYGYVQGQALILAGGDVSGQVIRAVKAFETRTWSTVHLFDGAQVPSCTQAIVEDCELGPAGRPYGSWADGISVACSDSLVRNNTIVDATDAAIAVFAAPGTVIEGNVIRAETQTLLGGIAIVDYAVFGGDHTNLRVRNNVIDADGAVIRIGLAMGPMIWVCIDPQDHQAATIFGGAITGNTLQGDHIQYGFAVDGVRDWTVTGNIDLATHSGTPTGECNGNVTSPPAGFQFHSARAEGTFQAEFTEANVEAALFAIDDPQPR